MRQGDLITPKTGLSDQISMSHEAKNPDSPILMVFFN
jgi:hypothetical protein